MLVAVKTLKNLAEDIRVESKMLKRDLLKQLIHCLDHTDSIPLLHATVHFLWKLSAFTENLRLLSVFCAKLDSFLFAITV